MLAVAGSLALFALSALPASAAPAAQLQPAYAKFFDLQGHRGARGEYIESTLPAFAHSLKTGITSLEMDNGITRDGESIIWHDESIDGLKCKDTAPAFADDPDYPYVGKQVANLTLAQIKTLDCGSLRLDGFPLQLTVPGTKISTMREMFDFVKCATSMPIMFNIESKTNPVDEGATRSPEDFVKIMTTIFKEQGPDVINRITHQSFDWRNLILSKETMPELRTAALCDDTTVFRYAVNGEGVQDLNVTVPGVSAWLGGVTLDAFTGTTGERVAQAAKSIKADFLSPVATSYLSLANDFGKPGFKAFTTADMVDAAHELGLLVKPWTPNRLNLISYLLDIGVDGVITDHVEPARRLLLQRNYDLPGPANDERVVMCLKRYNQLA